MNLAKTSSLALASILFTAFGFSADAQPAINQATPSLLVNVLDRNGGAVRDLTKDSFRVGVNGHAAGTLEASYKSGAATNSRPSRHERQYGRRQATQEVANRPRVARGAPCGNSC